MAINLRETTVGEVCEVFDGPHATPAKTARGPIFLGITSLKNGRIDLGEVEHLSEEDFRRWTRRVTPRPGDVVFSYETKLGEAAIIPEGLRCCLGRRMALLRPDAAQAESRYLLYYYLSPEFQEVIRARTIHGSTVDRLPLVEFPDFPLRLPPLAEQKAIVGVLGALDDKIELNRRMNTTLEAMAQALFKSWFVDFDPVRAKLDSNRLAGLNPAIRDLFPDTFDRSILGQIPLGWSVGTLNDATSLIIDYRGRTPKKMGSDWSVTGIPAVSAKNVKGGRLVRPDMFNFVSEELYQRWMKDKLALGDILMTSEAPLGELYYLALESRFCLSQRIFAIRADATRCESTFLYYWLESSACQTDIINRGTGTTVEGIRQSELRKVPVLLAPLPIQQAAAKFLGPWTEQIHRNEQESRTLSNLRDTLLPTLLSGEIRVPMQNELQEAVG